MSAPALTRREALAGLGAAAAACAWPGAAHAGPRALPEGFLRGVIVSCPGYGRIWGAPAMKRALDTLTGLGVTWTQIHPYAGVSTDGRLRRTPAAETGYLPRCAGIAKAAGHHLFSKPHLAYWGSFEWRGAITFSDDAAWDRFFTDYEAWIVDQARFAERHRLPLFSVGVEYKKTIHHEARWRRIIAAVRKVYRGPLTYAANWDEVAQVPFWDALDLIGVQAYFPLARGRATPSVTALVDAWDGPMDQLTKISKAHGDAPIVFTEIGYPRSADAAAKPWKPAVDDSPAAVELRSRLFAAAFARMAQEPRVRGAFWWKWIPGDARWDRDFSMKNPEARAALAAHWAKPTRTP